VSIFWSENQTITPSVSSAHMEWGANNGWYIICCYVECQKWLVA
jgi:hypothetical protein